MQVSPLVMISFPILNLKLSHCGNFAAVLSLKDSIYFPIHHEKRGQIARVYKPLQTPQSGKSATKEEEKIETGKARHLRLMIQLVRTRSILWDAASPPLDSLVGHAIHGCRDFLDAPNLFSRYLGR
jgi:hypothetical protein